MKKLTTEKPEQTHAEFLASLRRAHDDARPVNWFKQWPTEYLLEAKLPMDWLEKCGLIHDDGKLPSQCSQRKFAEIVTKLYGKPITQSAVSRAIKSDGLKFAMMPGNGRLKTAIAINWWRENKAGMGGSAVATEAEEKAARNRIAREREEIELDELKRLSDSRWMVTEAHAFEREGSITIFRQERIAQGKKSLDNARATGKAIGMDDAMIERQQALLREIEKEDFKAWQIELVGDPNVPGSIGKLGELDKASWELSEQRKAELKKKI